MFIPIIILNFYQFNVIRGLFLSININCLKAEIVSTFFYFSKTLALLANSINAFLGKSAYSSFHSQSCYILRRAVPYFCAARAVPVLV